MPYQIRYSVEEEEVSAIFEESEIAKRFHEALKGREQFLEDYTSKVKDFLAPLIKRKKLKSRVLTASNPALAPDFVNGLQYGILYSAIGAVTSKKQFNNLVKGINYCICIIIYILFIFSQP